VAGHPAVAVLRADGDKVISGLFFYRRTGRDIALEEDGGPGKLKECNAADGVPVDGCEPTGRWEVSLAAGRLAGSWVAALGGKPVRPIVLVEAREKGEPLESYARLRLADNRVIVVGSGKLGSVAWKEVREARSGARGRILQAGGTKQARERINREFEGMFHEGIGNELTQVKANVEKDHIVFANERLLARTAEYHVWGGAHPSFGFVAMTWDLFSGEKVRWPKRLRFTDPSEPALDLSRDDLVAALALRLMQSPSKPAKGEDPDEGDGCFGIVLERYGCSGTSCTMGVREPYPPISPEMWTAWPTAVGLALAPDVYNEAERGCRGEPVVIPWGRLQRARLDKAPLP
jgi:hypothetical protein